MQDNEEHPGCLNEPTVNEVAMIVPRPSWKKEKAWRSFHMTLLSDRFQEVNEINEMCSPLRFPLLFMHGEKGWAPKQWKKRPLSQRVVPEHEVTPPVSDDEGGPARQDGHYVAQSDRDDDEEVPVS